MLSTSLSRADWPTRMVIPVGERYQQINFDIPDKTWTLDNVDRIPDLFELGSLTGEREFDRHLARAVHLQDRRRRRVVEIDFGVGEIGQQPWLLRIHYQYS